MFFLTLPSTMEWPWASKFVSLNFCYIVPVKVPEFKQWNQWLVKEEKTFIIGYHTVSQHSGGPENLIWWLSCKNKCPYHTALSAVKKAHMAASLGHRQHSSHHDAVHQMSKSPLCKAWHILYLSIRYYFLQDTSLLM